MIRRVSKDAAHARGLAGLGAMLGMAGIMGGNTGGMCGLLRELGI